MNKHCRGCIRYLKSCSGLSKAVCEKHQLRIPRTNADRLRAMSDEELAWELCRIFRMPFYKDDSEIDAYEVDCWARWLKQEVSDNA